MRTNKVKEEFFKQPQTKYGYEGKPEKETKVDTLINAKGMKDLPNSSYSFKADPYQAALPESEPYPIINKFNKVVGGVYGGEKNIDGGNVQQYANSTTSDMLKVFDVFRTSMKVNYRYLPITPRSEENYAGKSLIDEMRKSIAEAVSILNSTTFTQLAINNFAIETDLPLGSAETINIGSEESPIYAYSNTTDVIYALSIYYQIFLQEGLSVMNWHNSFRLKQGAAIKNAWDREVPNLNSFFGLMNKKAFLSLLESINLSFEGEYVDTDFMKQLNTLVSIPSRRSNSMTDPILELQAKFNKPSKFKIYVLDNTGKAISSTPFYDDADLKLNIKENGSTVSLSYWDACDKIKDYLSLEATQLWGRINLTPASISETDNARYNQIKAYFDVLIASFTYFKPKWSDFREALDVMTRTGTVSWTKGFRPGIVKETNAELFWNVMIDHIYQMIFSGAPKLSYDDATKRWRTFSLWNMYSGTPEYDMYEGGAFITFSSKGFEGTEGTEQIEYLPLLFDPETIDNNILCYGVSRDGKEAIISQYKTNIKDNIVLNRLAPLASQSNLEIRVPTVAYSSNSTLEKAHFSHLYKTLTQIFGLARVQSVTNGNYDVALDPDLLSIYQIEINDITNIAITYARANAPFKGTKSTAGDVLGFLALR